MPNTTEESTIISAKYLGKADFFQKNEKNKIIITQHNNNKICVHHNFNNNWFLIYNNILDFLKEWTDVSPIAFTYVNRKHINSRNVFELM